MSTLQQSLDVGDMVEDKEASIETKSLPSSADHTMMTPRIKTLFPIDAKLFQYYYILEKIDRFETIIRSVKETQRNSKSPIVDPQAIILLSGVIFNVNENFYRRSELLQNCQKYNPAQKVDVPLLLNPISFDSLENISRNNPVGPYGIPLDKWIPLPNKRKALESMILLEILLHSVKEVINFKFEAALKQFNTQHKLNETRFSIQHKTNKIEFTELAIIENFIFKDIPEIDIKKQESVLKYYLKTQFEFLEIEIATFQNIIGTLKSDVHHSIISIARQKQHQLEQSNTLSPLYVIYLLLLRIADLYVQIRKSGKTIYFQNINYFLPYSKQRKDLLEILQKNSLLFTKAKQNSMLLTLISKYSRRTEIKNLSLDSNIFVSEFRKVAVEMIKVLEQMIAALKGLHNQWTMLVAEGRDNEFNKEYLREKMKERVANDRMKRMSLALENQQELKNQLKNQLSGTVSPKNMVHQKNLNRVSSIGNMNESIDENNELKVSAPAIRNPVQKTTSPSLMKSRPINGITRASSTSSSRLSSLTSSSHSPFNRPNSAGENSTPSSRTSSLTRTDSQREIARRLSVGEMKSVTAKKLSEIESISENNDEFLEPPKIGNLRPNSLQRKVSNSSLTPINSPKGSRTPSSPSSISSRSNSLTSSPSTRRSEMLQRRSSVNLSKSTSYAQLRSQIQNRPVGGSPSNAAAGASKASVRRRQSIIGLKSVNDEREKTNGDHARAAALATSKNVQSHLTAQQRLQNHIKKSSENGSVYSKPLDRKVMSTKSSMILKSQNVNSEIQTEEETKSVNSATEVERTIDELIDVDTPLLEITPASPIAKKKLMFDILDEEDNDSRNTNGISNTCTKIENENDLVNEEENIDKVSDFPSPLNSLKSTSLEAQNALKLQHANRSRSNSNHAINNNGTVLSNGSTPRNLKVRPNGFISPSKQTLSASPISASKSTSPTKNRSRSNSAVQKGLSNGSSNELSRQSTISRSRTRSRSSSVVVGNVIVYPSNDPGNIAEGEELSKKVRFTGVTEYSEDEDAPTPLRAQKQIKQKWAAYKPLFRKLNSQEGMVFKQNHGEDTENLSIAPHSDEPMLSSFKSAPQTHQYTLRSPSVASNTHTPSEAQIHVANATRRLSRIFRRK